MVNLNKLGQLKSRLNCCMMVTNYAQMSIKIALLTFNRRIVTRCKSPMSVFACIIMLVGRPQIVEIGFFITRWIWRKPLDQYSRQRVEIGSRWSRLLCVISSHVWCGPYQPMADVDHISPLILLSTFSLWIAVYCTGSYCYSRVPKRCAVRWLVLLVTVGLFIRHRCCVLFLFVIFVGQV